MDTEFDNFEFLVTFKTKAYEDGHVLWLKREFKPWLNKIREIPGVLGAGQLEVKKAKQKSGFGSIELGITVAGGMGMASDFNTAVAGNVVSAIRKSYAEFGISNQEEAHYFRIFTGIFGVNK